MNRFKKALSAGMSAALLASLFATAAAPAVLAAAPIGVTTTSAGTVPVGGTSTGTVSFAFNESSADHWAVGANELHITLTDAAGASTITFDGTPTITGAPDSLTDLDASASGAVLTINFSASNTSQVENFTVGGLKLKASSTAMRGAIRATIVADVGVPGGVPSGMLTASGTLQNDEPAGSGDGVAPPVGDAGIEVILDAGSPNFAVSDANNGSLVFSETDPSTGSAESKAITVAPAPVAGVQSLTTITTANFHPSGLAVTQSVNVGGALGSPGTVVDRLVVNALAAPNVQPGENNQVAGSLTVTESAAGTIPKNGVVTFTLDTPGVLFSSSPTVGVTAGNAALSGTVCNLSFDRTSCSTTVTTKSTAAATITLSNIRLDLAASVPQGTQVGINVTSGSIPVSVTNKVIATVSRIIVGTGAQPTIYINENDQPSGMITLTEQGAGYFTAGATNNYFGLVLSTGESFTRAPWAVVVGGNLTLRSGATSATSVQGTLFTAPDGESGVYWVVYNASTVASTIEIRGSDATNAVLPSGPTNGPRLSVPGTLFPGTTQTAILSGSQGDVIGYHPGVNTTAFVSFSSNAVRAYRNQPVVAALSQPIVPKGATNALVGNLTITETQAGQFKAGETITVTILPRTSAFTAFQARQDIFLKSGTTADNPVVSTNSASGLLTGGVAVGPTSFSFTISQQATGTLGVITISNFRVISLADALDGSILVRVQNTSGFGQAIDQVVSNGKIGTPIGAGTNASALGVTTVGPFSTATKVAALNRYQTFKISFGAAAAGKTIGMLVATKNSAGVWSSFVRVTGRVADSAGNVYYYVRKSSATWISVRGDAGDGALSNAVQGRWR